MKKKYNGPQIQVVYINEPITLLAGTNKEIPEVTYSDPTNPTSPPASPVIGDNGDGDDETVAAKPWTPM